jgi:hypothetical protein
MKAWATAFAESGLFGVKNWQQALALGAIAEADGLPFATACRDFHVVQGRPVMKSSAMLARFQKAGGKMRYLERSDTKVSAEFSHPSGGTVVVDWDVERAKRAGLAGKDNYKNYPRQMLTARVLSEGITAVCPGATGGLLTPEEAADAPEPLERDVTPAPVKPLTGLDALRAKIAPPTPEDVAPPVHVDTTTGELLPAMTYAEVTEAIKKAVARKDADALLAAVDLIRGIADEQQRAELDVEARAAWKEIKKAA